MSGSLEWAIIFGALDKTDVPKVTLLETKMRPFRKRDRRMNDPTTHFFAIISSGEGPSGKASCTNVYRTGYLEKENLQKRKDGNLTRIVTCKVRNCLCYRLS